MHTIKVDMDQITPVLRNNSYFQGLSQDILAEIARGTQLVHFSRGEIVFWEGEECAGLHMLEKLTRSNALSTMGWCVHHPIDFKHLSRAHSG